MLQHLPMLARITGILERVEGQAAWLAIPAAAQSTEGEAPAPGVVYEVLLTSHLAATLAGSSGDGRERIGATITLCTVQVFESQTQGASFTPRLYGFATLADRRFFELLTKVKGLGAKKAMRIFAAPAAQIAGAITRGDVAFLKTLPEVGPKLAQTIVSELQDAAAPFAEQGAATAEVKPSAAPAGQSALGAEAERAVDALVRLGQQRAEAERAVRKATERDRTLQTADQILAAAFASV